VAIRYCPFIQVSVVLYRAEFTVLLSNEEETTGVGGIGLSDSTQLEILSKELSLFLFFFRRQGVDTTVNRCRCI
jgi:hypothetical protein